MYDKYEDSYSEDEGLKWDVSSCYFNSELLYQADLSSLYFIEDIPYEMHEGKQVLGYGIWSEVTDVSFTSCHEHPLHGYFEEKLDSMQGEIQLEHQYWGKKMKGIFEYSPGFMIQWLNIWSSLVMADV